MARGKVVMMDQHTKSGASPVPKSQLSVGDQIPNVVFEDIDGAKSSTGKLVDKIQVMGFANQRNGSKLGGWLRKAGLRVAQDYPDLEVVHLGFADVSQLPRLLKRLVVPLLRTIHDISKAELEAAYGRDEVLYLAPDWDGRYFEEFGLQPSEQYTCWVVENGKIVGSFEQDSPRVAERFLSLFKELAAHSGSDQPS